MGIGDRIKLRRKEIGLSAEQVAETLGVSPATVYRYESAEILNMRIDKLEPIAEALRTTPAYLMGWEDDPDPAISPGFEPMSEMQRVSNASVSFQVRLKQLRERAGFSQQGFADNIGVKQSTVGNWESGVREPKFDMMERLADFFGVSVDYLLGRDGVADKKKEPVASDPESDGLTPEIIEVAEMIQALPQDKREAVLHLLQTLSND